MSTPSIAPPQRDPADVAPADSYRKADPVWVYRDGWKAGVIEAASPRAVTVTYRPGAHLGTGWQQHVILDGMMYIRGRDQVLCFDLKK